MLLSDEKCKLHYVVVYLGQHSLETEMNWGNILFIIWSSYLEDVCTSFLHSNSVLIKYSGSDEMGLSRWATLLPPGGGHPPNALLGQEVLASHPISQPTSSARAWLGLTQGPLC